MRLTTDKNNEFEMKLKIKEEKREGSKKRAHKKEKEKSSSSKENTEQKKLKLADNTSKIIVNKVSIGAKPVIISQEILSESTKFKNLSNHEKTFQEKSQTNGTAQELLNNIKPNESVEPKVIADEANYKVVTTKDSPDDLSQKDVSTGSAEINSIFSNKSIIESPNKKNDDSKKLKTKKHKTRKSKSKINSNLEKELKRVKDELNELDNRLDKYKSLLSEKSIEVNKWKNLNIQSQEKIFMKLDEYASRDVNPFENIVKSEATVGFVRQHDSTIHCGNNVYISLTEYNNAKNKLSGKDTGCSRFVKEIVLSIIGIEDLKNSSVTGRRCNRTKSTPKKKLNPNLLGAVYGIFKYFLATEKNMNPIDIEVELKNVATYISQKIADLNRAPRKKIHDKVNLSPTDDGTADETINVSMNDNATVQKESIQNEKDKNGSDTRICSDNNSESSETSSDSED